MRSLVDMNIILQTHLFKLRTTDGDSGTFSDRVFLTVDVCRGGVMFSKLREINIIISFLNISNLTNSMAYETRRFTRDLQ